MNWQDFTEKIQEWFYPNELRWQKQEEFLTLTQGSMSVQAYTDKFTELSRLATAVIPSEAERVKRYIKKMDPRIRVHVISSGATTFQRAYEVALEIHASVAEEEETKKRSHEFSTQSAVKRPLYEDSDVPQQARQPVQKRSQKLCNGCKKVLHPDKRCDGTPIVCYNCKQLGHKSLFCPKKQGTDPDHKAPVRNRVFCMTHDEATAQSVDVTGEQDID